MVKEHCELSVNMKCMCIKHCIISHYDAMTLQSFVKKKKLISQVPTVKLKQETNPLPKQSGIGQPMFQITADFTHLQGMLQMTLQSFVRKITDSLRFLPFS